METKILPEVPTAIVFVETHAHSLWGVSLPAQSQGSCPPQHQPPLCYTSHLHGIMSESAIIGLKEIGAHSSKLKYIITNLLEFEIRKSSWPREGLRSAVTILPQDRMVSQILIFPVTSASWCFSFLFQKHKLNMAIAALPVLLSLL